jgi:hypothetical protein
VRPLASRPFLPFLVLSVAIHALTLSVWRPFSGADDPTPATILNAELVTIAPAKPVPPAPVAAPTTAKVPRARPPVRPAPPPARPAPAPDPAAMTVPQPAEPETASPEPQVAAADPEPAAGEPAEPVAEADPSAGAPETTASPVAGADSARTTPIQPVRDLPQSGSQTYEVFIGSGRLHIGRTLQTWTISDQTYRLSSFSETTGLAGFLRPYQLDYVSEGRVDASGFQPESFSVRRGRNGARQYGARFDWNAKELTFGPIAAPRKVPLPDGTLDVLSFIYQLVRAQLAPGRFQISVTTGSRFETYTLEVGAEEEIEVPTGTIRALPVRQLRKPGQESIEIWLAPERNYLPVRIRFLDRNGEISGEQLAADIAFAFDGR